MSEYWDVRCRCGEVSDDRNHGDEAIREAVQWAPLLHELGDPACPFYPDDDGFNGLPGGFGRFLMDHAAHGGMTLRSEYGREEALELPFCPPRGEWRRRS